MKTPTAKLTTLLAAFLFSLAACQAQTNLEFVQLTGTITNLVTSTARITIAGAGITNQTYSTVNSNSVVTGDPLPLAFTKVNHSLLYLSIQQTNLTLRSIAPVTHSTNSTAGLGVGRIFCDTNYLYVSIGTNAWRRVAIPTNTW